MRNTIKTANELSQKSNFINVYVKIWEIVSMCYDYLVYE